ncbi:MAG: 4-hydroxy-tetrahydrodipicolinate reductase [SAR202 cluster bacterium Io17-Chloro-G3]|nr:MAG: 4-hydroxy-tetrahydrodipicolinate reductase [SAR202 cluster bacterium Io17-Chloro-G3]
MAVTRVIVHGAAGRVGRELLAALPRDPEVELVGAVDTLASDSTLLLPDKSGSIPYETTLEKLLARCKAEVVVDFTNADGCKLMAGIAAANGLHMVIGSTGLKDTDISDLDDLSRRHHVGIVFAPNFTVGAVLLNYLARIAARFFDYADINEAHHEAKIDAPSGTAMKLAHDIAAEKEFTHPNPQTESLAGTRGGIFNGLSVHSSRMPGRMAHHEVVFGSMGQVLTLRHDTINRECYMPGVLLAVKEVVKIREMVVGLEAILGLV